MKSAVCISGQPRDIEIGYKYIYENVIKPNNADVFLHAWFKPEWAGKKHREIQNQQSFVCDSIDKLLDLYKPVSYCIESPEKFNWSIVRPPGLHEPVCEWGINATHSMFLGINRANHLKYKYELANSFKYDCVCRIRPDLAILTNIDFSQYPLDKINARNDCPFKDRMINDHFAFSNSTNMDLYSLTFFNIESIYNEIGIFNPEMFLSYNIRSRGLSINELNIDSKLVRNL